MAGQPRIRVTLLGTGPSQGVPAIGGADGRGDWGSCDPAEPRNRRLRTSALIEGGSARVLVDAGPDCRRQLLDAGVGVVDGVVFTHAHADHVMGLDELRQANRNGGKGIPAYGFRETLAELTGRFGYAFRGPSRGFFRPDLRATELSPGETAVIGTLSLLALEQDHAVMRTMGLRIGSFAYSTDVVRMPEETLAALRGVQVWVVGCFRRDAHPVHAGLAEVMAWQAIVRPQRLILTHMGPTMDWARLRAELPPGIEPGHDGMVIEA